MSVYFSFQEIMEEIDAISRIASSYISYKSSGVLSQFRTDLESIRTSRSPDVNPWSISKQRPLVTNQSDGEYEPNNRRGNHIVFAEITSLWEIACVIPRNRKPPKYFSVEGIASTHVRLYEATEDDSQTELAVWKMELGSEGAPGCHFHIQIVADNHQGLFPHTLSVPRLPSIILTPATVLEFVLAELFQERWRKHAAHDTGEMQRWRSIQKPRFEKLFKWHSDKINEATGSPWTFLKGQKPNVGELFVDD